MILLTKTCPMSSFTWWKKAVNDKMRHTLTGKGCYDVIVPKFKELVDKRGDKDYYIRGTFTNENFDFTEDF